MNAPRKNLIQQKKRLNLDEVIGFQEYRETLGLIFAMSASFFTSQLVVMEKRDNGKKSNKRN